MPDDLNEGQQEAQAKPRRGWPKGKPRKPLAEKLSTAKSAGDAQPDDAQPARPRFLGGRPVFKRATIAELHGYHKRPGEELFWAESEDPKHPNYVGKYLDPSPVGNDTIGYCNPEPWEVVPRRAIPGMDGTTRDDQGGGKGFAGAVFHGSMILMRTTSENFEIYKERDRLLREKNQSNLKLGGTRPERHADEASGGNWSLTGALSQSRGDSVNTSKQQLLNQAQRAAE